jgi:glucuronate isomerase
MPGENLLKLNDDRYLGANTEERKVAGELYEIVKDLPLICPHGHVDPKIFAENKPFPDPAELLIIPDHYVFRMLYSQGIDLEALGVPRSDRGKTEKDHRKIWQIFADHYYLFRGTPTGMWLRHEFHDVFGIKQRLNSKSAMDIYDQIEAALQKSENYPRAMFDRFNIEVLSTTDSPTDTLIHHKKIQESDWDGKIIPAYRPDNVTNLLFPDWKSQINRLSVISGIECNNYQNFIKALENQRAFFKSMGCTSTDHGVNSPYTIELSSGAAEKLFQKALNNKATTDDAIIFTGHMLMEMARMAVDDGMTMQIHPGSYRNYNPVVFEKFGADKGCDIPVTTDYVNNLKPMLDKFGNEKNLTLILFTLDESTYSRELAPLAGHYPALRLGPSWWFHDSREGMLRFRRHVTETAGFYNTVGFIDDTRAFPSIPVRHDLARRIDCRYLAELVLDGVLDMDEAKEIIVDLSYNLAKKNFKL